LSRYNCPVKISPNEARSLSARLFDYLSQSNVKYSEVQPTNGWTIWFTGLSGSGKSTLAAALASHLRDLSLDHELIDGDEIRRELCRDLGFSKTDRDENVRRIGLLAQVLNRHRVIVLVAAISPYESARKAVRAKIPQFVEVHVDCEIETLIRRDSKGLYRRAIAGQLPHFSGISDPYEPPRNPELYVNSSHQSTVETFASLRSQLELLGYLPASQDLTEPRRARA
jgi:adenylyl-sulfate kinase